MQETILTAEQFANAQEPLQQIKSNDPFVQFEIIDRLTDYFLAGELADEPSMRKEILLTKELLRNLLKSIA